MSDAYPLDGRAASRARAGVSEKPHRLPRFNVPDFPRENTFV